MATNTHRYKYMENGLENKLLKTSLFWFFGFVVYIIRRHFGLYIRFK